MKAIRETDYEELLENMEVTEEELEELEKLEAYYSNMYSIPQIICTAVIASMIGLALSSVFSISTAKEFMRAGIITIVIYLLAWRIDWFCIDNMYEIKYIIFLDCISYAFVIWAIYGIINRFTCLGLIPPLIIMIISLMAAFIYLVIKIVM